MHLLKYVQLFPTVSCHLEVICDWAIRHRELVEIGESVEFFVFKVSDHQNILELYLS